MAKVNKVITLHFEDRVQFDELTKTQVGNVVMALFEHFQDGIDKPELESKEERMAYNCFAGAMQRQIDRYCGEGGQSGKMLGNQNARKDKTTDEPTITVQ